MRKSITIMHDPNTHKPDYEDYAIESQKAYNEGEWGVAALYDIAKELRALRHLLENGDDDEG